MFRKLLSLLAILAISATPAFGQDAPPWRAFLFNASTLELVAVSLDGSQTTYTLGLPPNTYPMQADLPISLDGRLTAYCISSYDPNGAPPQLSLVVRDLPAARDIARFELGTGIGCHIGGFGDGGNLVAVGTVRSFPGDSAADPNLPLWQLQLLDVASGQTSLSIDSSTPGLGLPDDQQRFANLPMVRRISDSEIIFSLQPYATEGNPDAPAYRWERASGQIEMVENWSGFGIDRLESTGELAWLDYDPARISGTPIGPMTIFNVVKITDAGGTESVVYETGEWLPFDLTFIDGGRLLLVTMFESGNPDDPSTPLRTRIVALDRLGAVTEIDTYDSFVQTAAAPDGYVLLWAEFTGGATPPPIHLEYRTLRERFEIWSILSDNMGVSWSIASTTPLPSSLEPLPSFTPL